MTTESGELGALEVQYQKEIQDIPVWNNLKTTNHLKFTFQSLVQMQQNFPAMIISTLSSWVFENGNKFQVRTVSGLPLGEVFPVTFGSFSAPSFVTHLDFNRLDFTSARSRLLDRKNKRCIRISSAIIVLLVIVGIRDAQLLKSPRTKELTKCLSIFEATVFMTLKGTWNQLREDCPLPLF